MLGGRGRGGEGESSGIPEPGYILNRAIRLVLTEQVEWGRLWFGEVMGRVVHAVYDHGAKSL